MQGRTTGQGYGEPRLTDAHGEHRLARLVESDRRASLAQVAEKCNDGHDRKASEHTVHPSVPCMDMCSHRLVRVSMILGR